MCDSIMQYRISIGGFHATLCNSASKNMSRVMSVIAFSSCIQAHNLYLQILFLFTSRKKLGFTYFACILMLLKLCGDVESNPGPSASGDNCKDLSICHVNIRSFKSNDKLYRMDAIRAELG